MPGPLFAAIEEVPGRQVRRIFDRAATRALRRAPVLLVDPLAVPDAIRTGPGGPVSVPAGWSPASIRGSRRRAGHDLPGSVVLWAYPWPGDQRLAEDGHTPGACRVDVPAAAKELVSGEVVGPPIDDDFLVPAGACQQESGALPSGHIDRVFVGQHAPDRAEGVEHLRGRLRRHDVALE